MNIRLEKDGKKEISQVKLLKIKKIDIYIFLLKIEQLKSI